MTTYVRRGLHVENPDRNDSYHRLFLKYFIEKKYCNNFIKDQFPKIYQCKRYLLLESSSNFPTQLKYGVPIIPS